MKLGFKMSRDVSLVIEGDSVTQQNIVELANFLSTYQAAVEVSGFTVINAVGENLNQGDNFSNQDKRNNAAGGKNTAFTNAEKMPTALSTESCNKSSITVELHSQQRADNAPNKKTSLESNSRDTDLTEDLSGAHSLDSFYVVKEEEISTDKNENQEDCNTKKSDDSELCVSCADGVGQQTAGDPKESLLSTITADDAGGGLDKISNSKMTHTGLIDKDRKKTGVDISESEKVHEFPDDTASDDEQYDETQTETHSKVYDPTQAKYISGHKAQTENEITDARQTHICNNDTQWKDAPSPKPQIFDEHSSVYEKSEMKTAHSALPNHLSKTGGKSSAMQIGNVALLRTSQGETPNKEKEMKSYSTGVEKNQEQAKPEKHEHFSARRRDNDSEDEKNNTECTVGHGPILRQSPSDIQRTKTQKAVKEENKGWTNYHDNNAISKEKGGESDRSTYRYQLNQNGQQKFTQENKEIEHKGYAKSNEWRKVMMENLRRNSESEEDISHGLCLRKERFELARQYLRYHNFQELVDDIEYETEHVTLKVNKRSAQGMKMLSDFQSLKFEQVAFQEDKDASLDQLLKKLKENCPKQFSVSANKIHIVSKDKKDAKRIKEMITDLLGNQDKTTLWSAKESMGSASVTTKQERYDMPGKNKETKAAIRTSQERIGQHAFSTGVLSTQGIDVAQGSFKGQYSDLEISICQGDITELHVDAIVNAANRSLHHGGGVAKAIAVAAGHQLQEDCKRFIGDGNKVDVTGVFVSSGGHLSAKHVLHAVGPNWNYYTDKERCEHDLRRTVLRCLIEAVKLDASTLALPSISAAIFKVPPEICAASYMEAVKHFDEWKRRNRCSLRKILFVDVNETMVWKIKDHFNKNWPYPCVCHTATKEKDFEFAEEVFVKQLPRKETPSLSSQNPGKQDETSSKKSVKDVKTVASERQTLYSECYQIGRIQILTSRRPAMDLKADFVITIGKLFKRLSGIQHFVPCDNAKIITEHRYQFQFLHLSKPDGKASRKVCTVYLKDKDSSKLQEAFERLSEFYHNEIALNSAESLIVTSEILYECQNSIDQKLVGSFTDGLHGWLSKLSKGHNLKTVTITAEEDALPCIQRVFESLGDVQKVRKATPSEKGGYAGANRSSASSLHTSGHSRDEKYSGVVQREPNQNASKRPSSHSRATGNRINTHAEPGAYPADYRRPHSPGEASGNTRGNTPEDMDTSVDPQMSCAACKYKAGVFFTPCCKLPICDICYKTRNAGICSVCGKVERIIYFSQPDGYMTVRKLSSLSADGYEGVGVWEIQYSCQGGWLKDPYLGCAYAGTRQTAYLPATDDGFHVLLLLRLAFLRRLVFRMSLSAQGIYVTMWNGIPHKTSLSGGRYGYPDAQYILHVTGILANKGVHLQNLTPHEAHLLAVFRQELLTKEYFFEY